MPRIVLRSVAIVIALVAAIDPAITSMRATRPDVALVSSDPGDSSIANGVARELASSFTVVRGPFTNAVATVVVGTQIPAEDASFPQPVFAVVPAVRGAHASISALNLATRAPLDARVPVVAALQLSGARGAGVETELSVNGTVVDKVVRTGKADVERVEVPLTFVPTSTGAKAIRVTVRIAGAEPVSADGLIDIQQKKWAVLVFDPRPSWMSTFVRRALERDTRFVVTSRTVTSTNVSIDAGRPPASLGDPSVLELYDAIVVGAPDALAERDVDGISAFLRQRGGGVALLFDEKKGGRYEKLAGLGNWESATNAQATLIAGPGTDSAAMRATEWMWPARLPASATVLASSGEHPVVWQTAVGGGRLIVSGALDGWKFRDPAQSGFERFWQTTVGELADASSPAVELRLPSAPVLPGAIVPVVVTSRNAALSSSLSARTVRSSASVSLQSRDGMRNVRVWPDGAAGVFRGAFRAPDSAGAYQVTATADGASAAAPIVVAANGVTMVAPEDAQVLAFWASATGGQAVPSNALERLSPTLQQAVRPQDRRSTWHPMRSPWWLLPFVLALSGEWWLRRRRGLA